MKKQKILLSIGVLAFTAMYGQAPLFNIDENALFYISENALMFNGGTLETKGSSLYDIHGTVMIVGNSTHKLRTLNNDDSEKINGGNIVLRLNDPQNFSTSSYGQLFISGLAQSNITGIVDKEYRDVRHGQTNYFQQIALPFYQKSLNSLSTELNKVFSTTRWSQNEILKYDNAKVVSVHYTNLSESTTDPTGYYMIGSKNNDFDASAPLNKEVYTLRGVPYADNVFATLENAGTNVNYGVNGTARNQYNETYNSYLQDKFDFSTGAWTNNFGKNLYQYGNPFFTNLDLSKIGYIETATNGDQNQILSIQGIRYDAGVINTLPNGSTYSTGALIQTFVTSTGASQGTPVGDTGLIIKPLQPFVIKLTERANTETNPLNKILNFNTLRRFNSTVRNEGVDYDVTANKSNSANTVKQLGVKGLDVNGNEIARAYYVVYPEAISGHPTNATTQATNSSNNLIGTFEEDKINGGYDMNYINSYWLYINEANEFDFFGKGVPFAIYDNQVKFLKFEILENTVPLAEGNHQLSTGIGFFYKTPNGVAAPITQNQVIPVGADQYNLYYGQKDSFLENGNTVKPSRTKIVYKASSDEFYLLFDSKWKSAEVTVFDMSGKLINKKVVKTSNDYELLIPRINAQYIVNAISDNGEIFNAKIIR